MGKLGRTVMAVALVAGPSARAFEPPVAVVACFLDSGEQGSCEATAQRLRDAGFPTRLVVLTGKPVSAAVEAVPMEGDPFVVVVGHGEIRNGRHRLISGSQTLDTAAYLRGMEQRNPRLRLWFESCFGGKVAGDADPRTCIGTACRGDELNYYYENEPSESLKPLLRLLAMPGDRFRALSGGGCEITAPLLKRAIDEDFGEGPKQLRECIVSGFEPDASRRLAGGDGRLRTYAAIDEDKAPARGPGLKSRSFSPEDWAALEKARLSPAALAAAKKACAEGPLKDAAESAPSEYRYALECGKGPDRRIHVLETFLPDRRAAEAHAGDCRVLEVPVAERLLAYAGGKRYRDGDRALLLDADRLEGIRKRPHVPHARARDEFTAPNPGTKVPVAPVANRDWLGFETRQTLLSGVATPWVDRFAVRHPGCERDLRRSPSVSGRNGLQWRERPVHDEAL